MARKTVEKQAVVKTETGETLMVWRAAMPLSESEHEQLSNKLRFEEERSGIRIMLVPYSVEPEVVKSEQTGEAGADVKGASGV